MTFQVDIRSREQILADLYRTMLSETDLSAIAPNSDLATLLEAIAASQSQINVSALKILQSTNLTALVGVALDQKAESMKLPNGIGGIGRKPSSQSSGNITVGSSFSKVSSKLYAGKPAPFAGSQVLHVEDASGFLPTGVTLSIGQSYPAVPAPIDFLYIGRGTVDRFEGKISFDQISNNGSSWAINLVSQLTKSHLHSDLVVLSQGGDRSVPAGTTVQIPANSQSAPVSFITTRDLVIEDGDAEGSVGVVCTEFGEAGNALAGSIKAFSSVPFSGATVVNKTSYNSGKSTESDEDLRQRIKNYPATLSRGTKAAISAAIQGASDTETGRTIQSVVVLEPVEPGDFARVYIDDGTGLEPTFKGQAYELILQSAFGQEKRFRTAQFPVTAATVEAANFAPYVLQNLMEIIFHVDEVSETYQINASNYKNINSASAYEVVRDLNSQSNIVGFRTMDGGTRIAAIDLSGKSESIRVESGTLQDILGFPTATIRPIFVYQNSSLKSFRGHTATLEARPRNNWATWTSGQLANNLVRVDGVTQSISIVNADFLEFGSSVDTATIGQWATVLSRKIAGVKFTVSGQILVWSTYQTFSEKGTLEILEKRADGSDAGWIGDNKMWLPVGSGGVLSDSGFEKDYQFNRFTGEISFLKKPVEGTTIEIGSRTTRAHIRSSVTNSGVYSLTQLPLTVGNARLVVGFDGTFIIRSVSVPTAATLKPSITSASLSPNIVRLDADSVGIFVNSEVGDWMYLVKDMSSVSAATWLADVEGFYRIKSLGNQLFATDQTYAALPAVSKTLTAVTAATKINKATVTVTDIAGHGLKSGDLITVTAALAIGGISAPNLSVTNTPILVIDETQFMYEALASATSTVVGGSLSSVQTNVLIVTHTSHGFKSGSLVTVTSPAAVAISLPGTPINVLSLNTYEYRTVAVLTSPSYLLALLTYLKDSWIEIELSSYQSTAWAPLIGISQTITSAMINVFKTSVVPQLIDFGAVSDRTVDQIVEDINNSIEGGSAVKLSPQQLEIRSNDFDNGTCAVLAVIGNASNLISVGTDTSRQSHTASSQSGNTLSGFPVISSISLPTAPFDGYPTRTFLSVDRTLTDITTTAANPAIDMPSFLSDSYPEGFQHIWLTGRESALSGRVYNNQVTAPFTGIMRGENTLKPLNTSTTHQTSPDSLDRYSNYGIRLRDLSLNNYDRFVAEMDLNAADKTVAVPMYKSAKILSIDPITGTGKGQVITFKLKDPDDANKDFFDPTSVYKDFDFNDFKILTKSVGLYREGVSDRGLIIRSVDYGATSRLRFSIRYPELPDISDIVVTHVNDYLNGEARLNLIATLPSQSVIVGSVLNVDNYSIFLNAAPPLFTWRISAPSLNVGSVFSIGDILNIGGSSQIAGSFKVISEAYFSAFSVSAQTTPGSAIVVVTAPGHIFNTNLISVLALTSIGGIPAVDLTRPSTIATNIPTGQFSYVAASAAPASAGVLASITVPGPITHPSVAASTTPGSAVITITGLTHGLSSGNLIDVTTFTDIGGISFSNLSVVGAPVLVLSPTSFTYVATAAAPSDTGALNSVAGGIVTVLTPYNGGMLTAPVTFNAATAPISGFKLLNKTWTDVADAVNAYLPDNPVAIAEAIGTFIPLNPISDPTYVAHPAATHYAKPDLSGALRHHSFDTKLSGSAGIFDYNLVSDWIKATVQSNESIFPTVSESSGTTYSPINESVIVVPTNTKTAKDWLKFNAASSLSLLTNIEVIHSNKQIQLSSKEDGSSGAVRVTGVSANTLSSQVIGNASNEDSSIKVTILSAEAKPLTKDSFVELKNQITSDILRPYRTIPDGTSITPANTTQINTFFRQTNAVKYLRVDSNTGRIIFLRNGLGPSQTEPLSPASALTFMDLGSGLMQIIVFGGGTLSARVGDMMYIQPTATSFTEISRCKELPLTNGTTDGTNPEYLGYPVVFVVNSTQIIVLAPNITQALPLPSFALLSPTNLVFMPAIWNEKNIRTNHREGADFDAIIPNNRASFLVKTLGSNMVSVWIQNSPNEATDTMLLLEQSVNTDDLAVFGEGFDPANQGSFQIIAHNGRNHLIIHNPNGGKDELVDSTKTNGGTGSRVWKAGDLTSVSSRPIRIVSSESVKIGDYLRISTPTNTSQWFNSSFFGSWKIKGIGFTGRDYTGALLPHTPTSGVPDNSKISPYVDFEFPNAPIAITDISNAPVDSFLIGTNDTAIGFTEGTPFSAFRSVVGHAVSATNVENSEIFLVPRVSSQKISATFGTTMTALYKMDFAEKTKQGIDGYKIFGGLVQQAHRLIDGLPTNTILYPGVKAAGASIEVLPPLIKSLEVSMQVRPKDGVTLNSISELVKASVASYVNGLGVGRSVILSEIVRLVQSLPGVYSIKILSTLPVADDDRIVVSDSEKAFILNISTDISVG